MLSIDSVGFFAAIDIFAQLVILMAGVPMNSPPGNQTSVCFGSGVHAFLLVSGNILVVCFETGGARRNRRLQKSVDCSSECLHFRWRSTHPFPGSSHLELVASDSSSPVEGKD